MATRFTTARWITRPAAACCSKSLAPGPRLPREAAALGDFHLGHRGRSRTCAARNITAQHPVVPAGKTAAASNFDVFQPFGRTRDVIGARGGAHHLLSRSCRKRPGASVLRIAPDPRPEAGHYYRSDHFSFARVGIPSFSIDDGEDWFWASPLEPARSCYRRVQRQPLPSALRRISRRLGFFRHGGVRALRLADRRERGEPPQLPTWRAGDEFLAARVASGVK